MKQGHTDSSSASHPDDKRSATPDCQVTTDVAQQAEHDKGTDFADSNNVYIVSNAESA